MANAGKVAVKQHELKQDMVLMDALRIQQIIVNVVTNAAKLSYIGGAVELHAGSNAGCYDVILMDIRMPNRDEAEAAKAIRALDRPDGRMARCFYPADTIIHPRLCDFTAKCTNIPIQASAG